MNFDFIKKINLNTLVRILIFLAMTILIALFMPRPDRVKYSYEVSKPWEYPNLYAPFEFVAEWDADSIARVTREVSKETRPVFSLNDSARVKLVKFVRTSFNNTVRNDSAFKVNTDRSPQTSLKIYEGFIGEIYEDGVVDDSLKIEIQSRNLVSVPLWPDTLPKLPKDANVTNVRTVSEAYEYLVDRMGKNSSDDGDPIAWQLLDNMNIRSYIRPNLVYNKEETDKRIDGETRKRTAGTVINANQLIVSRGQIVTPEIDRVLRSYELNMERRENEKGVTATYIGIGQFVFAAAMMAVLYLFLYYYKPATLKDLRRLLCLLSLVLIFFLFGLFMQSHISSGIYIVPFAIVPIVVMVFFDTWIAMIAMMMTILISAPYADFPMEFIIIEFIAGMTAIYSTQELSKRSQLMVTSILVCLAYIVSYCTMQMMLEGTLDAISWKLIGFFGANMVLTSFAYILIFVVEKIFGFTSIVTLVELSDINHPLLRELSVECPGTFQHSLSVSNLASAAAQEINANPQLVRAGALYHDIGKLKNPAFFTENQHGTNPHDALTPIQSARIIIGHITDGLKRAEKQNLPKVIRDMIVQHHGKSVARYFYNTYCNQHLGEEVDPAPFTYPGPNPQSKEASLLMMADVVEAASRSLPDHSPEKIEALVNKLIDAQVNEGLHSESPLSFRDITTIKRSFIKSLQTMYHVRIAYPEKKTAPAEAPGAPTAASTASASPAAATPTPTPPTPPTASQGPSGDSDATTGASPSNS